MENIENVMAFLKDKITKRGGDILREPLNLVPTIEGENYCTDEKGISWISYVFIEDAVCHEKSESPSFLQLRLCLR